MDEGPLPRTFLDEVLVECPRCSKQALIHAQLRPARLTCGHCGHVREADSRTTALDWWSLRQDGRDRQFGLPLWLAAECCGGHILWALNERHLDYLERFVASTQRDRDFPSPPGSRALAYKLPKWMQLAGHRDEVLHTVERLRKRLG